MRRSKHSIEKAVDLVVCMKIALNKFLKNIYFIHLKGRGGE